MDEPSELVTDCYTPGGHCWLYDTSVRPSTSRGCKHCHRKEGYVWTGVDDVDYLSRTLESAVMRGKLLEDDLFRTKEHIIPAIFWGWVGGLMTAVLISVVVLTISLFSLGPQWL